MANRANRREPKKAVQKRERPLRRFSATSSLRNSKARSMPRGANEWPSATMPLPDTLPQNRPLNRKPTSNRTQMSTRRPSLPKRSRQHSDIESECCRSHRSPYLVEKAAGLTLHFIRVRQRSERNPALPDQLSPDPGAPKGNVWRGLLWTEACAKRSWFPPPRYPLATSSASGMEALH